jgi:hypothetical protein
VASRGEFPAPGAVFSLLSRDMQIKYLDWTGTHEQLMYGDVFAMYMERQDSGVRSGSTYVWECAGYLLAPLSNVNSSQLGSKLLKTVS